MIERVERVVQLKTVFSQRDQRNNNGKCQQAVCGNVLQETSNLDAAQVRASSQSEQCQYPDQRSPVRQVKGVSDGAAHDIAIGSNHGNNGKHVAKGDDEREVFVE